MTGLIAVLTTSPSLAAQPTLFNVRSFGATGDGVAMDTIPIQKAINACSEGKGGVVWIPPGSYQIATIHLKSNVTLSLDHGASLLGSTKQSDYGTEGLRPSREGNSECLLYAEDATNIRIEGLGEIDGRGKPEVFPRRAGPGGKDNRPRLIRFEKCENLTFSGLTYRNPAFWGIHLVDCSKVHFTGVTIRMRDNHSNNDGIDIDGCEDVLIENCDIDSGDDAICLKSSLNPCRNVVVRDCKVSSHTAALKCGTSSSGGFINLNVSNCYFYDCPMGAIKLQIVDGGRMENVDISRITMDKVGAPISIRLGNRGRKYTRNTDTGPNTGSGGSEGADVGSIQGVRISDVVANVTIDQRGSAAKEREMAQAGPIMIAGIPGHWVQDVALKDIRVTYPGGGSAEDSKRLVPEDIARYPEQYFFGVLPAWGAYVRHAKGITFENVRFETRSSDGRMERVLDDVVGFREL